jgi:hypothetical protein
MIDDCDLSFGGKGKLVIQYLLDRGWKIALSGFDILPSLKEGDSYGGQLETN